MGVSWLLPIFMKIKSREAIKTSSCHLALPTRRKVAEGLEQLEESVITAGIAINPKTLNHITGPRPSDSEP